MRAVRQLLLDVTDHNPMRRRIDRIDAWIRLALWATLLVIGPALSWQVGRIVYSNGQRVERIERADRVMTTAVLLADAPGMSGSRSPSAVAVPARWTGPDGLTHTARLLVDGRSKAGSTVTVWTDVTGRPVHAPQPRDQTIGQTLVAAFLTGAAVTALLAMVRYVVRRVLDRCRLNRWQLEWGLVEPQWSRRS
jgi:hypothetical protein